MTPDPRAAAMFASMHPSGDGRVYRVQTVGAVDYDPDCTEKGLSYCCDAAVIVGKVKVGRKVLRRMRRVMMAGGPA